MAERTRPIRIEFCVTGRSGGSSKAKWHSSALGTWAHISRKMAIDGYIIKVDYTQQKKLAAAVSRVAAISTRFAAASTAPGISMLRMLRN